MSDYRSRPYILGIQPAAQTAAPMSPLAAPAPPPPAPPGADPVIAGPPAPVAAPTAAPVTSARNWLTMYDRAQALGTAGQPAPPKTDVCLVYAGGLTPDPWTREDMAAQTARYFLVTWVAKGTGGAAGKAEGQAFLFWLHQRGAPHNIVVCLDLETRGTTGDLEYEQAFRAATSSAGYFLMLYGSVGNLFEYPKTAGGYFVANPPDPGQPAAPHMYPHPGVVATQWRFAVPGQDWDLSVLDPGVRMRLWDRHWTLRALALADSVEAEAIELRKLLSDYA